MKINQRDIILLPYPFSNLENKKVRPALVVSNNQFNNGSKDCIVVPLTSVIQDEVYSVIINQQDMEFGKLIKPSRIKTDKIFHIEKKLAIFKIGAIKENVFSKVKAEIIDLL